MLTSLIFAVVIAASPIAVKPVAQGRGKAMVVGKGGHLKATHSGHRSRRH